MGAKNLRLNAARRLVLQRFQGLRRLLQPLIQGGLLNLDAVPRLLDFQHLGGDLDHFTKRRTGRRADTP
ncbi:hypothetical protein D3C84_1092760 [compost metagenome]